MGQKLLPDNVSEVKLQNMYHITLFFCQFRHWTDSFSTQVHM